MGRAEIKQILKDSYPALRQNYHVKKLGLFGSYAKGTHRQDSDIDILIEFEKPLGFKFIELAEYLEKQLGKRVDILTAQGLKSIRVKKVARDITGSMIYV